jgi:hypothetical protein
MTKVSGKFSFAIFVLNFAIVLSQDWFTSCDKEEFVFTPVSYFRSKWYAPFGTYRYETGSSCRYHAIAPPGYIIRATCDIQLDTLGTTCLSQRLYISRDGDKQLRDAEYFCGTQNFITRNSIGSEMTLAYTSQLNLTGRFECRLQAIQVTSAFCECGWNFSVSKFNKYQL